MVDYKPETNGAGEERIIKIMWEEKSTINQHPPSEKKNETLIQQ